jgi:hypothetical protein
MNDTNMNKALFHLPVAIAFGLGTVLLGRYLVKKAKKKIAERHSIEEGNPTTYAKQLHMAFQNDNYLGWGTNVTMVMDVFNSLPSKKMYQKVQTAYQNLYSRSLNADLEDELSSDEYNTVIRIITSKRP